MLKTSVPTVGPTNFPKSTLRQCFCQDIEGWFSPKFSYGQIMKLCIPNDILRFLAHLDFRPCELLSSLFVCRPSVNISHFNLLLRNHWTNCNQTLMEWSLDGPLSELCPVIQTSNHDGRQAQNRKKGG